MPRSAITVLAVGFVVIMLTLWAHNRGLGAGGLPTCPNCKKHYSGNPGSPCPKCGRGHALEAPPNDRAAQVRSVIAFFVTLGLEIASILVALAIAFRRSRPLALEELAKTRCPQCSMKLRYDPRAAGKEGKCPQCKNVFTFPPQREMAASD